MKHSKEYPPNYIEIQKAFPKCEERKAVFTYGETLHNPFNTVITRDLEIHEAVHAKQQGKDPKKWWNRYIDSHEFRLEQELEAYGVQLYHLKNSPIIVKRPNKKDIETYLPSKVTDWYLEKFAEALSGELYGNLLNYHKVHTLLRHFVRNVRVA